MKLQLTVLVPLAAVGLLASVAVAANTQQNKMTACNAQATEKSLTGDARKGFMKSCLSATSHAANSQQAKMKTCNHDASDKHLTGPDRQTFMKACLSTK